MNLKKSTFNKIKDFSICYFRNNLFYPKLEWSDEGDGGEYPKYFGLTTIVNTLLGGFISYNLANHLGLEERIEAGMLAGAMYSFISSEILGSSIVYISKKIKEKYLRNNFL